MNKTYEELEDELHMCHEALAEANEREQALAAHVERMSAEMKRCMSFLHSHFPSSDKDAAFYAAKKCVEDAPVNSLARRDKIKQAEALDNLAGSLTLCFDGNVIDKPSILKRADELRLQAEAEQ